MGSLSSWLERKRSLEGQREILFRRLEELDREIINAHAEYAAIYNKDAPILSLPAEVICLIFLEAFSTLEFNKEVDRLQVQLTEVALSHVCRQWRSAAIGLPILWSSFYYHGPSATHATLNRFKVYLDRSKSNTLELWFYLKRTPHDPQIHSAILDQAIVVVSRWRLVSIFSDGDSTDIVARLKTLHAPNLEHLALIPNLISPRNDSSSGVVEFAVKSLEPHIFTAGAPKLISAWLDFSAPIFCLPPISTVTTLRIEFRGQNKDYEMTLSLSALRVILAPPNLENLSVVKTVWNYSSDTSSDILSNAPLFMPRLRNLRISNIETLFYLLPSIRAPLLETLVLQDIWIDADYGPVTSIQKSNPYSFPSLTSLSLLDISFETSPSLLYFARITSATRKITVVHNKSEPIVGVLGTLQPSQEPLWPHLETLLCDFNYAENGNLLFRFVMHQKSIRDLILRVSTTRVKAWKEVVHPDTKYRAVSAMCTVEEVPDAELQDAGPWPPGGDGVLGRRIDLEADPFIIKSNFRY